mgnify:CR=1 FL=1
MAAHSPGLRDRQGALRARRASEVLQGRMAGTRLPGLPDVLPHVPELRLHPSVSASGGRSLGAAPSSRPTLAVLKTTPDRKAGGRSFPGGADSQPQGVCRRPGNFAPRGVTAMRHPALDVLADLTVVCPLSTSYAAAATT